MAMARTMQMINGIDTEIIQKTVAAVKDDPGLGRCKFRARNTWAEGTQNATAISDFYMAKQEMRHQQIFQLRSDEPPIMSGGDKAPNPVEHLLNALAACVTTSIVAHAAVRGLEIRELESELEGDIDLRGFLGLDNNVPKGFTNIRVNFKVASPNATPEQLRQLAEFSPVYSTLTQGAKVDIQIKQKK